MTKPTMSHKCYDCKHRRDLSGDAHSRCVHPSADSGNSYGSLMATFASVGRVAPVIGEGAAALNVRGNPHGIRSGWFNWPWNFDPVWLENCDGFEDAKAAKSA